jgi:hypothetical protein
MIFDGSLIFAGVNFVIAPLVNINQRSNLAFQNALMENGVEFSNGQFLEHPQPSIVIGRNPPNQFQTKVGIVGQPNIGQLIVISDSPGLSLDSFVAEAEAIATSFDKVWSPQNRQVISRDVTIRSLHQSSQDDAFKEIWESTLKQKPEVLKAFGHKVHGGGLRFVVAPLETDPEPHEIQVKIESFLTDPAKVFIETLFIWSQPMPANAMLNAKTLLREVDRYVDEKVRTFITEAQK